MAFTPTWARILFAVLLVSVSQSLIPELNLAVSTPVLNQELAKNLGPMIVDNITQVVIHQTFTESMTYGLIKV